MTTNPTFLGEKFTITDANGRGTGSLELDMEVDGDIGGATKLTTPARIPYFLIKSSVRALGW